MLPATKPVPEKRCGAMGLLSLLLLSILLLSGCGENEVSDLHVGFTPHPGEQKATVTQVPAELKASVPSAPSPSGQSSSERNTSRPHSSNRATNTSSSAEKLPITVSGFSVPSTLCEDQQGPNCTELPLGDDYLSTSAPAKGYLYSCQGKNPGAPGATESNITWINFSEKTWNFLKKLWLPQGTCRTAAGTYSETTAGDSRQIRVNGLPVDGRIGDWPMTRYGALTEIDRNPGIPAAGEFSFSYPARSLEAASPTCLSLGPIGVTRNGVVLYNAADARGEDALAREIVDEFGGHPAMTQYHYHFIPERLDNETLADGHSGIVGYINDGFPIYGYKGRGGVEMSNADLDICHGHQHGTLGYHYHATLEYPYTVGCYKGVPIANSSGGGPPPSRKPPGTRP